MTTHSTLNTRSTNIHRIVTAAVALGACVFLASCQGQKFSGKNEANPSEAPTPNTAGSDGPNQDGSQTDGSPENGDSLSQGGTGDTSMAGNGTPAPGQTPGRTTPSGGSAMMTSGAAGVTFGTGIDAEAIRKCLNLWGTHPFKSVTSQNFKKMAPNIALFGVQINPVEDMENTSFDKLILIDVSIKIASTVNMKLLNPKGWYCMKADIASGVEGIRNTTNVKLACSAKLAKNDLSVAVNSTTGGVTVGSQSVGQFGIAIDSTVTLARQTPTGGACPN